MSKTSKTLKWLAVAGIAFGVLTIASGGRALFGDDEVRSALGNIVPFVLWFNFLAGFVYVLAGGALLAGRAWGGYAALFLAVATGAVFIALGVYAVTGGAYEIRTIMAMTLRSGFWLIVGIVALRARPNPSVTGQTR